MSLHTIHLDGITATVEIEYHPRTLFSAASVELLGVQRHDDELTTTDAWDRKAEAHILATHGDKLQSLAEEAHFERQTGALA